MTMVLPTSSTIHYYEGDQGGALAHNYDHITGVTIDNGDSLITLARNKLHEFWHNLAADQQDIIGSMFVERSPLDSHLFIHIMGSNRLLGQRYIRFATFMQLLG